jgi:hypothetical protein
VGLVGLRQIFALTRQWHRRSGQDLRGSIFELGWSATAALAVLTGYSATTATTLAASVTGLSICRKNRRPPVANASAAKLRLKLGGWPHIREPMPSKPKWTRRRTYQRSRNEIQALEAQAKQTRFRKEIDIRTFDYHVS